MRMRLGDPPSSPDQAERARSGLGSPRVRWVAFGISVTLHLVAILLYPRVMQDLRPGAQVLPVTDDAAPNSGAVVVRLMDLDASLDPERPDDPDEIEDLDDPDAEAEAPVLPETGVPILVRPGPTAAERLRPNLRSARLWARLPPEFYELTMEQREELLLSDRIVAWYDSVVAATEAEQRLTDWTFRDSQGGRWGVSEGKLHLGDLTIPLPVAFGVPVGKRDEINRRAFEDAEIARQSRRFLVETTWAERAAAIRARRDRERAAARGDTIGGR